MILKYNTDTEICISLAEFELLLSLQNQVTALREYEDGRKVELNFMVVGLNKKIGKTLAQLESLKKTT